MIILIAHTPLGTFESRPLTRPKAELEALVCQVAEGKHSSFRFPMPDGNTMVLADQVLVHSVYEIRELDEDGLEAGARIGVVRV